PDGEAGGRTVPAGERPDRLGQQVGSSVGRAEKDDRASGPAPPPVPAAHGQHEGDEQGGAAERGENSHGGGQPGFAVPGEPQQDGPVEPDRPVADDDVLDDRAEDPTHTDQRRQRGCERQPERSARLEPTAKEADLAPVAGPEENDGGPVEPG